MTDPAAGPRSVLRIAGGRDAEIYEWDELTVFRVLRLPADTPVEREMLALSAAHAAGAPVPTFYERITLGGRTGLTMERLEPEHLLDRLGRAPWRVGPVGRLLGDVHARLHAVAAPRLLPSIKDLVRARIAAGALGPARRGRLLDLLDALPDGERLHHGDFSPANLLRRSATGEWLAVDWSGAARGDPAADVAHTLLMIDRGTMPETAPAMLGPVAQVGRRLLARAYLGAYALRHELDMRAVGGWLEVWDACLAA